MKLARIQNKKGAIELSIGTIVIIVLAMSMLILGLVLVKTIFSGATDSVKQIDQGVKNEINKLFSENEGKKLVVFPDSKLVKLKKGSQDEGFALSVRNGDDLADHFFAYRVVFDGPGSCGTDPTAPNGFAKIIVGQSGKTGTLTPKDHSEPVQVRFAISEEARTCTFRVRVEVDKDVNIASGGAYAFDFMDIQTVSK